MLLYNSANIESQSLFSISIKSISCKTPLVLITKPDNSIKTISNSVYNSLANIHDKNKNEVISNDNNNSNN